jgi:pyruvate formate lyase activating enzyme
MVGRDTGAEAVLKEPVRDRPFYSDSGGGVTVSGGEPLMQAEFLLELLKLFKAEGLHTALETSGCADYQLYEKVLPYTDLFLYDYKETNNELHKKYTGADNALILKNLRSLHSAGVRVLLRCPVIPGLNDREDHFRGIAAISKELENLEGVELLPYHRLASAKAGRMGLESGEEFTQLPREAAAEWQEIVRGYGGRKIS